MYTLLDLAQRQGEKAAAIVEEVTTYAPEWGLIPSIPQTGTSYEIYRRTKLPKGGFRQVGGGVGFDKSVWEKDNGSMYLYEAQMEMPEDVMKAQKANVLTTDGDILADEAAATVQGSTIAFGSQFYYGQKADKNGFQGIASLVSASVTAGAANNVNSTSAYLVWLDDSETNPQGIHFRVGESGSMTFGDWFKQRVQRGEGLYANAMCNNFLFYVGLAQGSLQSVYQINGINAANKLTDDLGSQLLAKVPLTRRRNLRWFVNRTAAQTLQSSRSGLTINQGNGGNYAPMPTELQGIPLTITDSIADTERNGNLP